MPINTLFWNITAVLAKGDSEQVSINLYANNNGIPIKMGYIVLLT